MTDAPRFELDPPADPARDTPPGLVTAGLVAAGGFLVGGPFGLAIALLALVVWHRRPDWLGALLVGLLALSAMGTVLGAWPGSDSLRQSFADDRPWAAAAGLGAGVALLVAVARAARADRAPRPDLREAPPAMSIATHLAPWLPVAGVVLAAGTVSVLLGPEAYPAELRAAAGALRAGEGLAGATGSAVSGGQPPVAAVVAAAFPGAGTLLVAVLTASTALVAVLVGTRLSGRRVGLLAGLVAAALPLVWEQRLPGALAGLLVGAALLLAWPDRVTTARAGVAGGLLALASFSRPEAALVLPVLAAWLALWPDPSDRRPRRNGCAALVVVSAAGLVLGAAAMHAETGDWLPGAAAAPLSGGLRGLAHLVDLVALGLALDEARRRSRAGSLSWSRHLPWLAIPALALVVAMLSFGDHGLGFALGPLLAVGAATRLAGPTRASGASTTADRVGAQG